MNHNASYIFEIDGITVWERLRCVRNFLSQNRTALETARLGEDKRSHELLQLTDSPEDMFRKRELNIGHEDHLALIKRCEDEISFLESLEKELAELAEKTRIPGKTDEEMYEENFYSEIIARNVRKAHCDLISHGQVTPITMDVLLRCPPALKILSNQNLLQGDMITTLVETGKIKEIEYVEIPNNQ